MQRAELKIRDAFFSLNHALGLTLTGMAEAPLDQLLSEHFGPEVAAVGGGPQQKLYAYPIAYKSAGRPWGALVRANLHWLLSLLLSH